MSFGWNKLCVGVVGLALLVGWQDAAAPAAPSGHEAAARDLLGALEMQSLLIKGFDASIEAQVQANPAMAQLKDVLIEWGHKYMTWEVLEPKFIALYTETFTETELREMSAFYRTPTGQKAARTMPEMFEKGMKIGLDLANEHQPELEKAIMEKLSQGDK